MPKIINLDHEEVINLYKAGQSINAVANELEVSRPVIRRILNMYQVDKRSNAQANRLMMLSRTPEENIRNTASAHKAARNHIHTEGEKLLRAQTRERKQLHVSPSELYIAEMLRSRGLQSTPQKAVGIYNVDLAVENVAIEIYGGGWHTTGRHQQRSEERFSYILKQGWHVIVVWVDLRYYPIKPELVDVLEEHIKDCRSTANNGYLVLRGDGSEFASGTDDLDFLTIKPTKAAA